MYSCYQPIAILFAMCDDSGTAVWDDRTYARRTRVNNFFTVCTGLCCAYVHRKTKHSGGRNPENQSDGCSSPSKLDQTSLQTSTKLQFKKLSENCDQLVFKAFKPRKFVPWRNFARKTCPNYSDFSIIFVKMSALNVILLVCLSLVMLLQGNANQFLPAQCNNLSKYSSLQKVFKIRGGMQVIFSCHLICIPFC
jgi:hypothetical protein